MFYSVSLFSQAPLARGSHALPSVLFQMIVKENKNCGCFGPELVEVAMLLFTFNLVTLRAIAIEFKSVVLVVTDNTCTYIYVDK